VQYYDNIAAMCQRLGINNPVQEVDVKIESLIFLFGNQCEVTVRGSELNRAGRIYFQELFCLETHRINSVNINDCFKRNAAKHFAEFWNDAEEKNRILILELKRADRILIRWKK
jgi:hypothetical protein